MFCDVWQANKKGSQVIENTCEPLFFMEAATRFELVNSGFAVCLSNFYGFLPCSLMLFLSLYYQCVNKLQVVFCYIVFYPDIGYYGSKMVAGK